MLPGRQQEHRVLRQFQYMTLGRSGRPRPRSGQLLALDRSFLVGLADASVRKGATAVLTVQFGEAKHEFLCRARQCRRTRGGGYEVRFEMEYADLETQNLLNRACGLAGHALRFESPPNLHNGFHALHPFRV